MNGLSEDYSLLASSDWGMNPTGIRQTRRHKDTGTQTRYVVHLNRGSHLSSQTPDPGSHCCLGVGSARLSCGPSLKMLADSMARAAHQGVSFTLPGGLSRGLS